MSENPFAGKSDFRGVGQPGIDRDADMLSETQIGVIGVAFDAVPPQFRLKQTDADRGHLDGGEWHGDQYNLVIFQDGAPLPARSVARSRMTGPQPGAHL